MNPRAIPDAELRSIDRTLKRIQAPNFVPEGPDEVVTTLDRLCDQFLECEGEACREMWERVARMPHLRSYLFVYLKRAIQQLSATRDRTWLERGLAALSLEDGYPDQRDSYSRADELWEVSAQLGIDVAEAFEHAATRANNVDSRGFGTTAEMLRSRIKLYGRRN